MPFRGYDEAKTDFGGSQNMPEWIRQIAEKVNLLLRGATNATGTVTLTANDVTTTLTDRKIGANTRVFLQPTTANAAAALSTTYFSTPGQYSVVINHANAATTDRTFKYVLFG